MSKRLIIDAGHGGSDSGAIGFGVKEKDWTLKLSLYLYERLKSLGVDVHLTRNTDETLEPMQRVARIKDQYDYCVSNHWNAFNEEARGVEGIHSIHAKLDFATDLVDRVVERTGLPLRRVFTREMKKGVDYYFMHRLTGSTETVILEYGFIDNAEDFAYYSKEENFVKAAEAVIEGLCKKLSYPYEKPGKGTKASIPDETEESYSSKRLVSHHPGNLRFYNKPSWEDKDVFGSVKKGQGFPVVVKKMKVGRGEQYQVENSKGEVYYITASPVYVSLV